MSLMIEILGPLLQGSVQTLTLLADCIESKEKAALSRAKDNATER